MLTETISKERRDGQRFAKSFPVKCRTSQHHPLSSSSALDISTTGVRILAKHNFRPASRVTLQLSPTPARQLQVQAEVMWVSPNSGSTGYEVGLRFLEVLPADFLWLKKWLGVCERRGTQRLEKISVQKLEMITEPRNGSAGVRSNYRCQCGEEFTLRVELAFHCESYKHLPEGAPAPQPAPAAKGAAKRKAAPKAVVVKRRSSIVLRAALWTVMGGALVASLAATRLLPMYYQLQSGPTQVLHYQQ